VYRPRRARSRDHRCSNRNSADPTEVGDEASSSRRVGSGSAPSPKQGGVIAGCVVEDERRQVLGVRNSRRSWLVWVLWGRIPRRLIADCPSRTRKSADLHSSESTLSEPRRFGRVLGQFASWSRLPVLHLNREFRPGTTSGGIGVAFRQLGVHEIVEVCGLTEFRPGQWYRTNAPLARLPVNILFH